ncbi:MAG TPA: OB-fold domain-containing protein, partial [Mycobacterium sp.]|nr:OB-fold domain-containing protein [Mycobacterium sp.]
CRRCGSDTTWTPASGDATLITWTATPPSSKAPDTAPRTFGYVELAEGPWLETILVDVPADALREGAPLHVTFLHHPDGEPIPAFGLPPTGAG